MLVLFVARRPLPGDHSFREGICAAETNLRPFPAPAADEPCLLAMAREAAGERDTTAVSGRHCELARVHERIEKRRRRHEGYVADRQDINRAPKAPPATRPLRELARGRAMFGETPEDMHD